MCSRGQEFKLSGAYQPGGRRWAFQAEVPGSSGTGSKSTCVRLPSRPFRVARSALGFDST